MKKLFTVLLALSMIFVMTACDDKDDVAEVANPVHTCESVDELLQATGIPLDVPSRATDVSYGYIEIKDDDDPTEYIAQVIFTLDGEKYCYRAKKTDEVRLVEQDEENVTEALEDAIEEGTELSGLYEKWKGAATVDIADREAVVAFNEGKSGFIVWLDVVPGFLYTLSMEDNCTQDLLSQTAYKCFETIQGDSL